MKKARQILKYVIMALCLLGCLWFLLPFLHGGFRLGALFGLCVCLAGFLLLRFYGSFAEKGGWRKITARVLSVCYCLGLAWAAFLTGLMISANYRTPPPGVNLIVLGSQVYSAERMGVSLTNRVEKAAEYLQENPEAMCIVTGGQGDDEPCAESLTARNGLLRLGISEDRVLMEDRSRNTRQNLQYAGEIAEKNGMGTRFAVTTQSFHMYRATRLAESAGLEAYSLIAPTDPILLPEYYGRELLSLTKWQAERLVYG